MLIDTSCQENQNVLKYLRRGKKALLPAITAASSVADPYLCQGSHPDIVQWVWDRLGATVPLDCRCLIYGTPGLVHNRTGIVIAICNGTRYNLRLTADDFQAAMSKGASTRIRWSAGEEMDCLVELGKNWIFGGWFKEEEQWCRNTYEEYGLR